MFNFDMLLQYFLIFNISQYLAYCKMLNTTIILWYRIVEYLMIPTSNFYMLLVAWKIWGLEHLMHLFTVQYTNAVLL